MNITQTHMSFGRNQQNAMMIKGIYAGYKMVKNAITPLIAKFVAWRVANNTKETLARLSDEQLEDIGLTRHDVMTFINNKKW